MKKYTSHLLTLIAIHACYAAYAGDVSAQARFQLLDQQITECAADIIRVDDECTHMWSSMLSLYADSKDESFRKGILEKWNYRFIHFNNFSSELIGAQVRSLIKNFNRDFITPELLSLFKETEEEVIISSISRVLSEFGTEEDLTLLQRKLANIHGNSKASYKLTNAIGYFPYWNRNLKDKDVPKETIFRPRSIAPDGR